MSRSENRIRAYRYVAEQIRKVNPSLYHSPDKVLADVGYISLDDLARLREGSADPSKELVGALKKLLGVAVSEAEIDDYLVTPFL